MSISNYDIVIVGSGFVGSVIAYMAAKDGKRVLLLERRNHIAGNMYDEVDPGTGILIQKYGPHSFHTNDDSVFDFVASVGEWFPFTLTARVEIKGRMTPSPFNFATIDQFFARDKAHAIKKRIADTYRYAPKATILEMLESRDPLIKEYADFLFEHDYRPYTVKQWNIKPSELDVSVLKRVQVRFDYMDRYFDDRYQMMPEGGYTKFFRELLNSPLIDIKLNCDALERIAIKGDCILYDNERLELPLVYTGAVDELFGCACGKLPYRSLRFEYKVMEQKSFQPAPGVAYPMANGYTRITEYTKLPPQDAGAKTIIAYEYPLQYGDEYGGEPYYPVLTRESGELCAEYLHLAGSVPNLYLGGRLADFKYYNMDEAVLRALELYPQIRDA
jgi:UDP-galactopyranose mutase